MDKDELLLAREVAADWHGGQFTALYAYSSSGSVTLGLSREAERAAELATEYGEDLDAVVLTALAAYAEEVEDGMDD